VLAVGSITRAKVLPDVPTVAELGYKDFEVDAWFGTFAPANTPARVVSRLADWFTAAVQSLDVETKLAAQALYPAAMCGADFAAHMRSQFDYLGRVVRDARIEAK
jgi:tripartite-type tricarboxylate transporter receptor subunit TctC